MTTHNPIAHITTAEALQALHPDVSVKRDRLGYIEASRRGADNEPQPAIRMSHSGPNNQLTIIGNVLLGVEAANPTIIRIPIAPDGLSLKDVQVGIVKPEIAIALARSATELLAVRAALSEDERWEWLYSSEGDRIYDEIRPAQDSLEVLARTGYAYEEADLALNSLSAAMRVFGPSS